MPFLTKSKIKKSVKPVDKPSDISAPEKQNIDQNTISKSDDKPQSTEPSDLVETKKDLEKILAQKEETLRRLKLVQSYKSRKDIQNLDETIEKWQNASKNVLNDLFDHFKDRVKHSADQKDIDMTMSEFITRMKVDPKLVGFDIEKDCFE